MVQFYITVYCTHFPSIYRQPAREGPEIILKTHEEICGIYRMRFIKRGHGVGRERSFGSLVLERMNLNF